MKLLRPILPALLLATLAALPAAAQGRLWTVTGEPVAEFGALDDAVRDYMQVWSLPGLSLAISIEGRSVFARGYTWDDPAVDPVQPTSLFRIASMSKPITSVAVHMLIEQGLLDHGTLVADALGLEPPAGQTAHPWLDEITVDHLLYHFGGWNRNVTFDPMFIDTEIAEALGVDLPISRRDIATYMTGQQIQHRPGTFWAYSNYGYMLLGLLIEEVTGRDYSEWVEENIFQPIGVGRPRRGHTSADELVPGEVFYHGFDGQDPYAWNIENMDAHGGWIMSPPDYLRFLDAVFGGEGQLLGPATVETMVTPHVNSGSYARGWSIEEEEGLVVYGHGGSLPGTSTEGFWREDGFAVVAFLNTRRPTGDFDFPEISSVPVHDLYSSLGILDTALGAATTEAWIPVVSRVAGVGDSLWRSAVGLLSRSTLPSTIRLRAATESGFVDHTLMLDPGEQALLADVMSELGLEGSTPLRVFGWEPFTLTSRTFTEGDAGTFGQFLGGVTGPSGLEAGESAVLTLLREDEIARSNIGVHNAGRREARVEVSLYEDSGAEVVTFTRRVSPGEVVQLNRPFTVRGGRTDIVAGYAVVTILKGEEVILYGSMIDAGTNDPTTIPMQAGNGATEQWIAAAAHVDGAAGAVWRTALALLNRSTASIIVDVLFRGDLGDASLQMELAPGELRVFDDLVAEMGMEGSGSLEITSEAPVLAGSRTASVSGAGSFGQFLGAITPAQTLDTGDTAWLPQLAQSDAFRTNIGLLNTGTTRATVVVRLYDSDGAEIAVVTRDIQPGGRLQLQEPFRRVAGRTDLDTAYATVTVDRGSGVVCYASVIDNESNDPTTVPMVL